MWFFLADTKGGLLTRRSTLMFLISPKQTRRVAYLAGAQLPKLLRDVLLISLNIYSHVCIPRLVSGDQRFDLMLSKVGGSSDREIGGELTE